MSGAAVNGPCGVLWGALALLAAERGVPSLGVLCAVLAVLCALAGIGAAARRG